jgi:uncharacterized damage-inducible protein DinB
MFFRVGIENNVEGRSLAWVLEHPGCFAYGPSADHALAAVPGAIYQYSDWIINRNDGFSWIDPSDIELIHEDSWDVYTIDESFGLAREGYEVNAWFLRDWKPLTEQEINRGLKILEWSRVDLLETVAGLSTEQMTLKFPGERWSLEGILKHVSGAEWWYLNRLGLAFPKKDLPSNALERLEKVRSHLLEVLPRLAGTHEVLGIEGEFWSPRKVLRRAAWHERDHTFHINRLRDQILYNK